jgi:hypothetical protein
MGAEFKAAANCSSARAVRAAAMSAARPGGVTGVSMVSGRRRGLTTDPGQDSQTFQVGAALVPRLAG